MLINPCFFWLIMIGTLIGVMLGPVSHAKGTEPSLTSPIMAFSNQPNTAEKSFYQVHLKYLNTMDALPILRGLCQDCPWVVQHQQQSVGLFCTKKKWKVYRKAIKLMDKKPAMVGLDIDVIEIGDIQSERYQQLLSNLTGPIYLDSTIESMLQLMISSGNAAIVSSPRLIGRSGKKVILNVGDKIPYQTSVHQSSTIQHNVQYIQSGIQLSIVPYLHTGNTIDLTIELNYDVVNGYRNEGAIEMPLIASRVSKVDVQVISDRPIIFAGLLDKSEHESIEKVPFLGDLPIVGFIFQKKIKKRRVTDLIYKIRPFVVSS